MKRYLLVCMLLASTVCIFAQTTPSAADLLHAGLMAMGGEEKIRSLNALHIQALSERNMLEQSERPEGPYIVETDQVEEWRDLAHNNWKNTTKARVAIQPEFAMTAIVSGGAASLAFDGNPVPASGEQLQQAQESLEKQSKIESSDRGTFEEYLARYFAK